VTRSVFPPQGVLFSVDIDEKPPHKLLMYVFLRRDVDEVGNFLLKTDGLISFVISEYNW
jgi:hypothetical protein